MADQTDTPESARMVERMARAHHEQGRYTHWFDLPEWQRNSMIKRMERVLESMREPTEAMRKAAYNALHHWAAIQDNDTILKHVYIAMIDAAAGE